MIGKTKVVIVGVGQVGTTLAYYLVSNKLCNELVLIDMKKEKAWAEAEDMRHSMGFSDSKVHVKSGEYTECGNADIVVLTAARPMTPGANRLTLYDGNKKIMDDIVPRVMEAGFKGIFVVVSNPVDLITQYVKELSGLDDKQVIGTGTSLDSARLGVYLADIVGIEPSRVDAYCMGEHGDSQFIAWSQASIGGKPFYDTYNDNPDLFKGITLDKIHEDVRTIAYKISLAKGVTCWGIGSVTGQIIKAILFDEDKVMPVSVMLHGEYGLEGQYISCPAVIGSAGIKDIVKLHLDKEEEEKFKHSFHELKKNYEANK